MKPSLWILILSLIVLSFPVYGQSNTDWYLDKPIAEIRFEGLATVQKSDIEGVTRPYLGKRFSDALYQELQSSLYNLEFFDGLIVPTVIKSDDAGSAVIILFKVTEKPVVEILDFSGNQKIRTSDLQGVLTVKKGDLINPAKVKADEQALENYYREHGFLDIAVSSSTELPDPRKAQIIFKIKEGLQNAVKSITFQGNVFASESTLKGLMDTKAQSFFDGGLFKEAAFSKDLRSIESYYWNHGYIDARVINVERNIVFDKESDRNVLNLVMTIKEGEPLIFGGFSFEGNHIFTNEAFAPLVRQPIGSTISKERLEADYQRVVDLYLENGYIYNDIHRSESREGSTVKYKITIVERPRAHIENIVVKGNTKTKDKVILRELPIEVGDVFSKANIVTGLRNLNNLQYFGSVSPETPFGSADGLMDLVINVEEAKTADISFGLAFSGNTEFPISAQVKWSDRNFMGLGQTFGVDSTLNINTQSLNLSYTDPWFMDRRITLGGTLGFTHALNSLIDQDVLGPTYSDLEIPDPYKSNEYVFSTDQTGGAYSGFKAGDLFPTVATASDIATYGLITRYQYDLNHGNVRKNAQMQYDSWQFNLGLNTGYSWYTALGRFGLGTGEKSTLQLVTYDSTVYRPSNKALRDNLNQWMLSNQWWTKATWDTRDLIYNPNNGFILAQTVTFGGGFLGGVTHFTRFDSRAEEYWRFLSVPLAETYTLDLVFKARTAFSFLTSSLGGPNALQVQPTDQLFVDGMNSGRGWGYQSGNKATWTSGVEVRTPVPFFASFLWIDTFIDDSVVVDVTQNDTSMTNPFRLPLTTHRLSWGTGLRLIVPQFPLAIYLARPFQIDNSGSVVWTKSDGVIGDMKLVVAFGTEF